MYSGREMKGSEKMGISSVVACCDAPKVLELVETTFDAVTKPVGLGVMANDGDAAALGRDHGLCAQAGDEAAKSIAVIASVGDDTTRSLALKQSMGLSEIVVLTRREDEAQRSTERIG